LWKLLLACIAQKINQANFPKQTIYDGQYDASESTKLFSSLVVTIVPIFLCNTSYSPFYKRQFTF
jgi:hypothetical protein